MAAVEVTISGVMYDKLNRTMQNVVLIGEATLTGLGVGGGPIVPPPSTGGGRPPHPSHPIFYPPGTEPPVDPGFGNPAFDPRPSHPIMLPGMPGWPSNPPPEIPPPGSPPMMIPGTTPVHPITPPPAIIVDYPGIGKVLVPQPLPSE